MSHQAFALVHVVVKLKNIAGPGVELRYLRGYEPRMVFRSTHPRRIKLVRFVTYYGKAPRTEPYATFCARRSPIICRTERTPFSTLPI